MSRRIYIAGPMTGVPGWNYEAFESAAEKLTADGWDVYDPVQIGEMHGLKYDADEQDPEILPYVIKAELGFVARSDAIYLLKGWEKSIGTRRELLVALGCGLEIIQEV